MYRYINNSIIILLVSGFSMGGLLTAADCYIVESANPAVADGTEENPHTNFGDCVSTLGGVNNLDDTIYIGPGYYDATNTNVGSISIIGSGVNVTKIYGFSNCFTNVNGTIKNLAFDKYEYFSNGSNQTARCSTCITTAGGTGSSDAVVDIHNVLFEDYTNYSININRTFVEIRNNVFVDNQSSGIHFNSIQNIVFMNNLVLANINFNDVYTSNGSNNKFHNNLFLSNCQMPSFYGSTYNLVYDGSILVNAIQYGDNDSSCGEMGENQSSMSFAEFSELNFVVDTWNIYNIYASGENTILFDAGIPDSEFNDADGSRSDIGIMGGLYPWPSGSGPVITNFSVDPINIQIDGEVNVNSSARTE